jgi:hypothetical protein
VGGNILYNEAKIERTKVCIDFYCKETVILVPYMTGSESTKTPAVNVRNINLATVGSSCHEMHVLYTGMMT